MADTNIAQNEQGTHVPGEELSPVQQEALAQGWVPKSEYDGDPERFVDAGEFLRRGELFRKIESQSKELKDVRKALAEGDAERVVDLDDKIDLVKDQQRQFQAEQVARVVPNEIHPELANWDSKNPWYETDKKMRAFADSLGSQLAGTMSPTEVLREVEKEVKERYKEKFRNPNREKPGAVEGVQPRAAVGGKAQYELTDTERTIMNTLVKQKVLTEEQYIEQLKAVKERN